MKKRWQIRLRLLLIIILASLMAPKIGYLAETDPNSPDIPKQSNDSPIIITNEGELAAAADSGAGTSGDPYIIENRVFNASDIGGNVMLISGTTSYLTLRNITVFGVAEVFYQIQVIGASNILVRNCTFTDIGTGLYLDGSGVDNVNVSECIFQNSTVNSPAYAGIGGKFLEPENGIRIWNNTITNYATPGVEFRAVANITIGENTIDTINNSHSGIYIWDIAATSTESSNIDILNNTFKNIGGTGLAITVEADSLLIENNTVENSRGISVYSSSNVLIKDNVLDNSANPGGGAISVSGNANKNPSIMSVSGNTIQGYDLPLYFSDAKNVSVTNNRVDSTGMANPIGIYSSNTDFQNFTISGNHINNTRQAINLNGPSNGTIINNIFNNSLSSSMYCPFDLSNTTIYGNEFHNSGGTHLHLGAGDHLGLELDNGSVGNYWDDYKTRYPAATHNGVFYSLPYEALGSGVFDNFPTIGDEQPTADFLLNTTTLIAGQSVEASFTGEVGNLIAEYQWNFGEVAGNETGANPAYTYTSGGIYDVSLTVVDTDGDSATITKSAHVDVEPDNQPTATFTQNVTQLFESESVQFSFTGDTGNGGETYDWDFGDGTPHSAIPDPEHTYTSAGNYTVTLTVVDADGDVAVNPVTDLIEVIVDLAPVASFSVPDTNLIAGESLTFTFTGDVGNGGESFEWDFGDGSENGTIPNPSHIFTAPGTFNITLTVTDADGDTHTLDIEDYITVIPDLLPAAGFSQDNTVIIQGAGIQFTFTGDVGNGGETYEWDFGDGSSNKTDQNPSHLYADPGVYTVTLTVTDADGDSATTEMINEITVIEDLLPTALFTRNSTAIWENEIIQFNFTGDGGNQPVSYQWDFGDGSTNSSLPDPTHRFTAPGEYVVTLTVVDADGDSATGSATITVTRPEPGSDGLPPWVVPLLIVGAVAVVGGVSMGVILKRKKKSKTADVQSGTEGADDIKSTSEPPDPGI